MFRSMSREEWYNHLAGTNHRIVQARKRIENQKTLLFELKVAGRNTTRAFALLQLFEGALDAMNAHRTVILQKVRTSPLPVDEERGAAEELIGRQ